MQRLLVVFACAALIGCGSSIPIRQLAALGPFQVEVLPAGPPTWTYAISTDRAEGIVSVEVITPVDTKLARLERVAGATGRSTWAPWKDENVIGLRTLDPKGRRSLRFSLVAESAAAGVVYLRVEDEQGLTATLGPVAGPN